MKLKLAAFLILVALLFAHGTKTLYHLQILCWLREDLYADLGIPQTCFTEPPCFQANSRGDFYKQGDPGNEGEDRGGS